MMLSESQTRLLAREKASATWRGSRLVRVGDGLQHLAALAARRREIVVAERRIGNDGDAMLLAPRDHGVLDRAFLQMIEHLVAGDLALARHRVQIIEIVDIEIADAP